MNTKEYYIYEYVSNTWQLVDSVQGVGSTYYLFTTGTPCSSSESFCVAAVDSCYNKSNLSNSQVSLYLQQAPDQCSHSNTLSWNGYENLVPAVGSYKVYHSVNGGPFTVLGTTSSKVGTLIDSNLDTKQTICYYVQVVDSAHPNITASSNIICYQVTTPPKPKFDYLRTATVINNSTQNEVDGYMAKGGGIAEYIIKRANAPGAEELEVGSVKATNSNNISFIDPTANPNNQSYTYKIFCQDSCDFITDSTNIGETMYLTATGDNSGINTLSWNDYAAWTGGVDTYNIYRDEDNGPFTKIASIAYTGNGGAFTDDVSPIITGQGSFGYYVQAIEQGPNGYGFIDTSTSNIAIAYQDPRMYIPNAFNPKGTDNKVFIPVGVFVDLQNYDFTIFDRWGQLLFETNDVTKGWDGTFGGKLVEEGVYVYHIQYTSGKGEYFNQRGWVMMLK